ncbi:hypothetical protein EV359DRAFT_62485 [Lentinula novae-zelandiae]|nr:hypothetical protein EV359DRAFT_62485 [Lentinula novae-zelandiae]
MDSDNLEEIDINNPFIGSEDVPTVSSANASNTGTCDSEDGMGAGIEDQDRILPLPSVFMLPQPSYTQSQMNGQGFSQLPYYCYQGIPVEHPQPSLLMNPAQYSNTVHPQTPLAYWQTPFSSHPHTPNATKNANTHSFPRGHRPMKQTEMEQRFSRGLFHGVYENPEKHRKSRAQFQWPEDLGLQERLLAFENHAPELPSFSLPHYALPPSSRNLLTVRICSEQKNNTTRNAILDWAVQRVIEHVDDEAEKLTQLKTVSKGWKEKVNWDSILNWSMSETQETLALTAPVIFFFVTTIVVSRFQRKKLDAKAMGVTRGETEHSLDEEAIDDLPQLPTKGYKKLISKSLRDPWLGSTTVILTLLYLRYRYAAVFPTIMGIFLFSTNTNREVINVVSCLGLSIAYSTILAALHILAADSASVLRTFGAALEYGPPNFLLLFDNVNKNRHTYYNRLQHSAFFVGE